MKLTNSIKEHLKEVMGLPQDEGPSESEIKFYKDLIISLAGNSSCCWLNSLREKDGDTLVANSTNLISQADAIIKEMEKK